MSLALCFPLGSLLTIAVAAVLVRCVWRRGREVMDR